MEGVKLEDRSTAPFFQLALDLLLTESCVVDNDLLTDESIAVDFQ